jgi:hypothetical protein
VNEEVNNVSDLFFRVGTWKYPSQTSSDSMGCGFFLRPLATLATDRNVDHYHFEGELRKLYRALGLPDFAAAEPAVRAYAASMAGYRKNAYSNLRPETRAQVAQDWSLWFTEWGYPV